MREVIILNSVQAIQILEEVSNTKEPLVLLLPNGKRVIAYPDEIVSKKKS